MNEITCIFCSIGSSQVVIEENGYQGRKCPQCGLIYISPRPSSNDVVGLYEDDDAHISAQSHIADYFSKRIYARHHLKIMCSVVKNGALLEIGAGAGYFLDEARKTGFHPFGLELNPILANFIREKLNIPCEESLLNTSVFEGEKFDVVYHCDVTSHFFDPFLEFRKMNTIMKDDSYLIFETGNLGEVDPIHFKYFNNFQYPDHLFFFTIDNIRTLLDRTGFKVLKIYRYLIVPELIFRRKLDRINELKLRGVFGRARSLLYLPVARNLLDYFIYFLRYKIGYLLPKKSQPQTVIIIAQKKM